MINHFLSNKYRIVRHSYRQWRTSAGAEIYFGYEAQYKPMLSFSWRGCLDADSNRERLICDSWLNTGQVSTYEKALDICIEHEWAQLQRAGNIIQGDCNTPIIFEVTAKELMENPTEIKAT